MGKRKLGIDPRECMQCHQVLTQSDFERNGKPLAVCVYCVSKSYSGAVAATKVK